MPLDKVRRHEDGRDENRISLDNFLTSLSSKSFLASAAALAGAGGIRLSEPAQGSLLSALKPYAPAATTLAGSFILGFRAGWFARRRFGRTIFIAGAAITAVGLMVKFEVGGAALEEWADASAG